MGLQLNQKKSELICSESAGKSLLQFAPDLSRVSCEEAMLLGTAIGPIQSINVAILDKVDVLKTMGRRLCYLKRHDALLLLRHSFSIPKILYLLQTAPCFASPVLERFHIELRSILSAVLNINLDRDDAWF